MDSIPAGDSAIFSFDSPNTLAWGEYAINYYLHFSDSISDQCTDSEDTLVHTTYLGEFAIYNSSNPIPYLSYNIWVTDNITLGNAVVLGNGNELIARAGKSIEINPGVTIEPGSIADMRIQPCPEAPSAQRQGLSIVTSDNTSVEALTSDDSMKVHPNPFGNELFIEYNSSNYSPVSIRMYDMWGHEVRYIETQTEKGERLVGKIDVANLTPGVYIVAIYSGKVKRISCVAIKQ